MKIRRYIPRYLRILFRGALIILLFSGCSLSGVRYHYHTLNEQDLKQYAPLARDKDCIRFVVYGDTRIEEKDRVIMEGNNRNIRKIMSDAIKDEGVDFVIHTGDMVKDGSDMELWEMFEEDTQVLLEPDKYFPVLGNHEYSKKYKIFGDGNPKYYFDLFDNTGFKLFDGKYRQVRSYAFKYGTLAYIIVLDSNSKPYPVSSNLNTENIHSKWFDDQLTNAAGISVLIIALHHPVICSSDGDGYTPRDKEILLRKKLVDWKADHQNTHIMVFSSHNHFYERYEYEGTDFVVTGGGGAPHYEPTSWYTYESKFGEKLIESHVDPHYVLVTIEKGIKPDIKYVLFNHHKKHPLNWLLRFFR